MELLSAWAIWLIIGLILVIIEFFTLGFGVLCFSFGCFAACLLSLVTDSFLWQIALFSLVSLVCFIFVRPAILKLTFKKDQEKTNVDAIIGRTAIVSEEIKEKGYGRVKIDGDDWKAQATDDTVDELQAGTKVEIVSRDGIILTVKPL